MGVEVAEVVVEVLVKKGITARQTKQLIKYSNSDPEIIRNTSDNLRFRNLKSFNLWRGRKKRKTFTLTSKKGDLLGIIWFGMKPLPKARYSYTGKIPRKGLTFSIRIYSPARGRGLSYMFYKEAYKHFKTDDRYKKDKSRLFWIEASKNNKSALSLYKKIGFVQASEPSKEGKIVMVSSRT